jgi:hypothetical protein
MKVAYIVLPGLPANHGFRMNPSPRQYISLKREPLSHLLKIT